MNVCLSPAAGSKARSRVCSAKAGLRVESGRERPSGVASHHTPSCCKGHRMQMATLRSALRSSLPLVDQVSSSGVASTMKA